jgi:methylphosphotriester-DNA--protein-cysteine methyltransferase
MIMEKVDVEIRRTHEMSARRARLGDEPLPGERLVLVTDSPALRRFAELPDEYRARFVDGWDALAAALEGAPPSLTVMVDPYLGRTPSQGPSPRLREVMWRRPTIPFVAVMPLREEWADHASAMYEWGVSEVLDLQLETLPGAVWQRLRATRARPLKRRVEAELSGYASEYARNLVRAACEAAVDGGGAPELAALFGVEPRTASAWCRREGLPPPRRLLAWMRVLLAATLLEEDGRSVVNVARAAGYATDHALRRAMRELAGGDPSTVARGLLFEQAAERFNSDLRECRERVRELRRASRGARSVAYA